MADGTENVVTTTTTVEPGTEVKAAQVKLTKNGTVVYPQTVTDAVAYTPSQTAVGAGATKKILTEYLEGINTTANNASTAAEKANDAIANLDSEQKGSGDHVTVTVTQEDGKVKTVGVTESDIASAKDVETLQKSVADLQFNSLSPAMTHSGSTVLAVGGSAVITFNITTNGSVTTVDETNGPITKVSQSNTIDTKAVSTATNTTTISSTSANLDTTTVGLKTINATGELTHISGSTKTVSTSHSVRVVKPWYCGFIGDYANLSDPSTDLLNNGNANGAKVTASPVGQTISNIVAKENGYFVVCVPNEGGYTNANIQKIISKGAMDAEQAKSTSVKTLEGYTVYVCTDKANAGTYTYALS